MRFSSLSARLSSSIDLRESEGHGSAQLQVHISYYTGTIDDVPHIPERCWYASGLRQLGKSMDLPPI